MSKRFDRANGALRRLLTIAMVLVFLVGLAPVASAEPAAPAVTGTVTSITVNSPTNANKFYTNGGEVTVNYTISGSGTAVAGNIQVGPAWLTQLATPFNLPSTGSGKVQTNCTAGTYDVTVRAQGGSQTSVVAGTQFGAVVVDCTNPVVPANPLTAPNGGEKLSLGSVFNVTWDLSKITDANRGPNPISLDLQCVIGGAPINAMIATGLPNSGSYAWTVGGAVGDCLMTLKATDLAGNSQQGVSAKTFTISGLDSSAPTVSLLTPPGATAPSWNWIKGGPYNFTANASDPQSGIKTVEFEVSPDGGLNWPFVNPANTGPSPFGFSWDTTTLPENVELWVRAKATNGLDASTFSNVNRRIKVDNTAPNAGAITAPANLANVKGTVNVAANPTDAQSGVAQVLFQYSLAAGGPWQTLGTDTAAPWSVAWDTTAQFPNLQGNAWLRATATDGVGWTATTQPIQVAVDNKVPVKTEHFLTAPNGGEVWQIGLNQNITWNPGNVVDPLGVSPAALDPNPVTLSYSANGGASWTPIAAGLPLVPGLYPWLGVDNAGLLPGANYKVKIEVKDLAGNTVSDISNAPFTFWNNDETVPTESQVWSVAPLTLGFAKGTVTVTGRGIDLESGIQAIRFQVRTLTGATWSNWSDLGAAPSLTYDYPNHRWSGSVAWNTGSFSGQAELRAIAKNGVGMELVGGAFPVVVDNSAPTVTWDNGYASQCLANGGAFAIGVQAVESPQGNMASVKFEYSLNGGATWLEVNGAGTVAGIGPAFQIDWNTIGVADGPAILRATARNQAGLPAMTINRFVYIKNGAAASPQVTCLVKGWNLYSTPLVLNDANMAPVATVLAGPVANGTLSQVRTFVWEGVPLELVSKAWFPALGGDIEFIKDGQGYWLNMSAPDVLAVSGTERPGPLFPPRSYSVLAGWNMIGFTSVNARQAHEVAGAANYPGYLDPQVYPTVSAMYGYDRVNQQYVVPAGGTLNPNEGYWLAVNANGTLFP